VILREGEGGENREQIERGGEGKRGRMGVKSGEPGRGKGGIEGCGDP